MRFFFQIKTFLLLGFCELDAFLLLPADMSHNVLQPVVVFIRRNQRTSNLFFNLYEGAKTRGLLLFYNTPSIKNLNCSLLLPGLFFYFHLEANSR